MEQSPNIVYTGAAPNQQVIPAVRGAFGFLRKRRFFLIGWNSVHSHATNAIIRDEVDALGGDIVGEEYIFPYGVRVAATARMIARSKPDLIFTSIARDIHLHYTRALRAAGVTAGRVPTIYFCIGEIELQGLLASEVIGDYAAWNYFQSIGRHENHAFVRRFPARFGQHRVTNDPMEAAHFGVHLWAQAMEEAGDKDAKATRQALQSRRFAAPEGPVQIDPATQYPWKTVRIGRIVEGGQFKTVWSSEKPIRPEPYPSSRPPEAWHAFLDSLYKRWDGHWTKPHP